MTEETIVNLDSILNDEPAKADVEIVEKLEPQEPKTEETEGEIDGETPAPEENEEDELENKSHVPVKAVTEERKKRQAAEKEAREIKAELEELRKKITSGESDIQSEEGEETSPEVIMERKLIDMQINTSRNIMLASKQAFPDYEEKEKVFVEIAKSNPALIAEMRGHENPALFAYNKAAEHLEYQEFLENKDNFKEFLESKKTGKAPQTAEEKRKKSALSVPNLINSSSSKISEKIKPISLDDILGG